MKKMISVLLAIVLVMSFASVAYAAVPITKDQYYARSTLSGNELKFYDHFMEFINDKNTGFEYGDYGLTKARATEIAFYAYYDQPKYINRNDIYSESEVDFLLLQADAEAQKAIASIDDSMSDYEKARTLYIYVSTSVRYDMTAESLLSNDVANVRGNESQTIVGGLVNKLAVCAGISRTYQYLLYQVGIPCYIVSGTRRGGNHSWNIIQIDGQWYHADLTQDLGKTKGFSCFLVNDGIITLHHTFEQLDGINYNPPLPECPTRYVEPKPTPKPTIAPVKASIQPEPTEVPEPEEAETSPAIWVIAAGAAAVILLLVRRKRKA